MIAKEVGEGLSHAMSLPFYTIDLLRIGMCFKSIRDSFKASVSFTKTIVSKFDLYEF